MIHVFIDETSDQKNKKYFGITAAVINYSHYSHIKSNFQRTLKDSKWDISKEFKGSCLFSASKGDSSIDIDERINICTKLLALNKSKENARMRFYFIGEKNCDDQKNSYLVNLPKLLNKIPKAQKRGGKNLLSLYCDYRSDISIPEIREAIKNTVSSKEYILFEDIVTPKSGFETVGILYADIVGYLFGRIETISNDKELFQNLSSNEEKSNGKIQKLQSSTELIKLVKEFNVIKF